MKPIVALRIALAVTVCSATLLASIANKKDEDCKSKVKVVQCEQNDSFDINLTKATFSTSTASTLEDMGLEEFLKVYKSKKDK